MASTRRVIMSIPVISLLAATVQAVPSSQPEAELEARAGSQTYSGCYSTSYPLTEVGNYTYQSTGYCGQECTGQSAAVLGITLGMDCYCGNQLPPASNKVDDSKCNTPCTGYGSVNCGGTGFWSVYLTGLDDSVSNVGGGESSSSSSSTTTSTSTSTTATPKVVTSVQPGTTVVVTQPAEHATQSPSADAGSSSSSSGHSNTAGIAAGVVVGIVGFAAIIGGVYYYLRARQRRQAVEDYQRSTQVQDFMRQNPRPAVPSFAAGDQRLDPFAGRRNSVGSLADNQDYSRKILRVANPDGN